MRYFFLSTLMLLAFPVSGQNEQRLQEEIKRAPLAQIAAINELRDELKGIRQEMVLLRLWMEKLNNKNTDSLKPKTRMVWRQVRPHTQIEGMIDDGYELVEEPITGTDTIAPLKKYYLQKN